MSDMGLMEDQILIAFTVKKLGRDDCTVVDYLPVLNHWRAEGIEPEKIIYEVDGHGKLHTHGTIRLKKNFYRKKLNVYGYHIYFREVYNEDGWTKYINKHQIKKEA